MALSLKRKGFTNLTIYEKSNRVGGKSYDINYRGVPQPLGTSFAGPNYFDNLIPLAQEYGVGDYLQMPSVNVWATNSASDPGSQLLTGEYVLGAVAKLTNSTSPQVNLGFLIQTVVRYVRLHKEMFGDYQGDLMLQPSSKVMSRVRGTLQEFLTRENMLALLPVFKLSLSLGGYSYVDEVPAIYGLIWNNPKLMVVSALRALNRDTENMSVYILKDGFELVWKTIVEKEKLDVRYNTDIYSIKRTSKGVDMEIWKDSNVKTVKCDFMIWTPEMTDFLRTVSDASPSEVSLFRGLRTEILTMSLVNMRNEIRNGPYNAYTSNMESNKFDGRVTAEVSMMGLLTPGIRTMEGVAQYSRVYLKTLFYKGAAPQSLFQGFKNFQTRFNEGCSTNSFVIRSVTIFLPIFKTSKLPNRWS